MAGPKIQARGLEAKMGRGLSQSLAGASEGHRQTQVELLFRSSEPQGPMMRGATNTRNRKAHGSQLTPKACSHQPSREGGHYYPSPRWWRGGRGSLQPAGGPARLDEKGRSKWGSKPSQDRGFKKVPIITSSSPLKPHDHKPSRKVLSSNRG
jgi:hypothetical protein